MKELSIEEKAKRFDEALGKARRYYDEYKTRDNILYVEDMEDMFPELIESEDERIRKDMIETIKKESKDFPSSVIAEKSHTWIAWLEKQGEQKPAYKVESKIKAGDWVVCNNGPHHIFQVIERSWPNAKYRNIDGIEIFLNVETLDKQYHLWTIQDAKDGDVLAYRDGQWIFIYKEKIDDNSFSYYTLYSTIHQDLTINDAGFTLLNNAIKPATKEQRYLLFKKMKEAGYEWDAEKRELKKIENGIEIPFGAKYCELQEATYYIPKGFHAKIEGDKVVIKKGEQKPVDKIEPKFKVGDEIRTKNEESLIITRIDRCGYWSEDLLICNFDDADKWELVEQKPTWSKEDELHIRELESLVKQSWAVAEHKNDKDTIHKMSDLSFFLKTLKPQPKQEWSEEDERKLNDAILFIETGTYSLDKDNLINWLKSFKDRYTWKPSEEQMNAFDAVFYNPPRSNKSRNHLITLYNELKKLKG